VIVGKYFPPYRGGTEQYTADMARALETQYRVTVLAHNTRAVDETESFGSNTTVIRCGTIFTVKSQPISPSMWWHLARLKPDIIHLHAPNFWAAAALNVLRPNCPLIITHHCDVFGRPLLRKLVLPLYQRLVRRSAALVVTSEKNVKISADLPADIPRVVSIPCGVDERLFTVDSEPSAEREKRFGSAPVIGFVGRLTRYKGLWVLLDALKKLDDVHAILIGEGELRESLQEAIDASGMGHRVHLVGSVDEARKIREMRLMDVFVLPSIEVTEAFGIVQVEAQLLEKPIVVSELPTGVTDVTLNGQTGLWVPVGDADALAAAIRQLVDDPELAKQYGKAGRRRALANYTGTIFAEHFRRLFAEYLEPAPEPQPVTVEAG
jgi:rhamnosyl/mannosyltransferase